MVVKSSSLHSADYISWSFRIIGYPGVGIKAPQYIFLSFSAEPFKQGCVREGRQIFKENHLAISAEDQIEYLMII